MTAYDKGLALRRKVLGREDVDRKLADVDAFNADIQRLVTEFAWGAVWTRPGLSRRDRSLLNIAMLALLNRPQELGSHVRGALNNGCTEVEIREVLVQVAVYGGFPAALDGFRVARAAILDAKQRANAGVKSAPRAQARRRPRS